MSHELPPLNKLDASLIQRGLASLGYYQGSFRGVPGPKTAAAYDEYVNAAAEKEEPSTWVQKFIDTAAKEIGVEEVDGTNSGARVEKYQASTWLDGTGWPWCAAFVCWCYQQASLSIHRSEMRPETAAAWGFEKWAKGQPMATLHKPFKPSRGVKAGDIVMYKFSHVGIASEDSEGDHVNVIEGNTNNAGSREGGGVFLKRRKLSQIRSVVRLG